MTYFNELPTMHLIHDMIIDELKRLYDEHFMKNDVDIIELAHDELELIITEDELEEVKAYIKAKRSVYRKYKNQFHDISDIVLLETKRIRNLDLKINEIPF